MWIAAQNEGRLNVLDFGGSLGSTYYQNKLFLDSLKDVNWCIVEQKGFVKIGMEEFATKDLHFFNNIEDCLESFDVDVILLSSVLQYLEDPFAMIEKIKSLRIKNIIIDRTPFVSGRDRITIQKVMPTIYKASYPCWFFNKSKFEDSFLPEYKLLLDFKALDRANISSEFRGYFYELLT
jgi:putative methyltransferase (TIGR04325 family)